jgi:hypothetical protein
MLPITLSQSMTTYHFKEFMKPGRMKANELRIGNFVYDIHRGIVVDVHLNVLRSIKTNKTCLYQPIPLTEDWLLKFGFELLCRKSPDGYKDTIFSMQKPYWTLMQLDKGWGVQFWQGNKLEYVHQLQNLYFALTGEELEMK